MTPAIPARPGMLLEGSPVEVCISPGEWARGLIAQPEGPDSRATVSVPSYCAILFKPLESIRLRLDTDTGMQHALWFLEDLDSPLARFAALFERGTRPGEWTRPSLLHTRGAFSARRHEPGPDFGEVFPDPDETWKGGAPAVLQCLIAAAVR